MVPSIVKKTPEIDYILFTNGQLCKTVLRMPNIMMYVSIFSQEFKSSQDLEWFHVCKVIVNLINYFAK